MTTNEPLHNAADEVAAAEAELKAAQERLEAAKAKLSGEADDTVDATEDVLVEAIVVEDADGTVEAVIVEEVAPVDQVLTESDAEASEPASNAESPSAPEPEPASEPTPEPESAPAWVPYSTNQTPPPYGAPEQPTYGAVPPTNTAGYQAPNGYNAGYTNSQQHAGPGAVPPQQPYYGYQQPQYYQQPYGQPVVATKDHVAAGLLAIFLGWLGIHKFYLGYNTAGFIMLAVTILGSLFTFGLAGGVIWVISIIEGILYLTKSQAEFEQMYVINKREWF